MCPSAATAVEDWSSMRARRVLRRRAAARRVEGKRRALAWRTCRRHPMSSATSTLSRSARKRINRRTSVGPFLTEHPKAPSVARTWSSPPSRPRVLSDVHSAAPPSPEEPPKHARPSELARPESTRRLTYASLPSTPTIQSPAFLPSPPPEELPYPADHASPFTLWDYLREELLATDFDSHQELKWERVSNFLSIPWAIEKVGCDHVPTRSKSLTEAGADYRIRVHPLF
jgi:hypothetical protein